MPDESLGADFACLAQALRDDLAMPATEALARLRCAAQAPAARRRRAHVPGVVGRDARRARAAARVVRGAAGREHAVRRPAARRPSAPIGARLRQRGAPRGAAARRPACAEQAGRRDPHLGARRCTSPTPPTSEKLLDYLATRLYGGGGSHGIFSKTVGAGLAYSNGLRGSVSSGRIGYYAERTPELPQTVRFVIGVIKDGQLDPSLGEYVMAQAFGESRASQTYEARAEGIAADLADGQPPEAVRRFRAAILDLRSDPRLVDKLYERKDRVHARLLPGYDAKGLDRGDGSFFVIGPDKQLDAWERLPARGRGPGRAPAAALRARLLDALTGAVATESRPMRSTSDSQRRRA